MALDDEYIRYLDTQSRGRLCTMGQDGSPQNKPVGYRYNPELGTIDIGGLEMERSAKYRNIAVNPTVALVVDDVVDQDGPSTRFLEIRGHAEQVPAASRPGEDLGEGLIRIHPRRLVSWNLDASHPGMIARDVTVEADPFRSASDRPMLDVGGPVAQEATVAVAHLVEELQTGWDRHDADISNRHFAADIIWGSPFGATVHGYQELHAIHVRLKQAATGGASSRYETVQVLAPAPGLAVAQIRRLALERGEPVEPSDDLAGAFSEMALYVLVRHNGTWWLAAGQNTPIRLGPPG